MYICFFVCAEIQLPICTEANQVGQGYFGSTQGGGGGLAKKKKHNKTEH